MIRVLLSYDMLLEEINHYLPRQKERMLKALDAVVLYGGAVRYRNNWAVSWLEDREFTLYFQANFPPDDDAQRRMGQHCDCSCDFHHCGRPGWNNLYAAKFSDRQDEEILESWGLF